MYKNYLFLVSGLLFSAMSFAQCPTAPVTLNTQASIDNFATAYPGCTALPATADLTITGNTISNLNGLSVLTASGGAIAIRNNPQLLSIAGLSNLSHAGTELIIRDNPLLLNLDGLQNLQDVQGEFVIRSNDHLVSINSLMALTTVSGGMIVRDNRLLSSLAGLDNLAVVGEILEITENDVLTDISALGNVTSITGGEEGAVIIEGNPLLTSIMGLGNSGTIINGDITIQNNALLSQCAAESICSYLNNAPDTAVITIGPNFTGCNDVNQVLLQCQALGSSDQDLQQKAAFYPNPASGLLHVRNNDNENTTLTIYSSTGQLIKQQEFIHNLTVDIEKLAAGIYLVALTDSRKTSIGKLLVR